MPDVKSGFRCAFTTQSQIYDLRRERSMTDYDIDGELESLRERRRSKPKQPDAGAVAPEEGKAEGSGIDSEVADIKATWRAKSEDAALTPEKEAEPQPPAEEVEEPRIYVVKQGDSLSKIAADVYGKAGRWREIYEADKDKIDDPNLIQPGWDLRIP
jgi:nucleoid-associated protein YgaU